MSSTIKTLTKLKGIGPATASLLLSVHDAESVVFFSDEIYRWLCCDGRDSTIKYNLKEYQDLVLKSHEVISRLKVDARDVEKVAFVLVRAEDRGVPVHSDGVVDGLEDPTTGKEATAGPAKRKTEEEIREAVKETEKEVAESAKGGDAITPPPLKRRTSKRKVPAAPEEPATKTASKRPKRNQKS